MHKNQPREYTCRQFHDLIRPYFPWENAFNITYKNSEGKIDYLIAWKCPLNHEYYALYTMHHPEYYYSDYTKDNTSVFFMESPNGTDVYGILLDTQNITYTEEDLVYDILGLTEYELTYYYGPTVNYTSIYDRDYDFPIDVHDASTPIQHYKSPKMSPYEMARNDPDWYYDHYDYGDNADLDEYLYDQGYYYDDE